MALNPKLEFFRFNLKSKNKDFETFKDFAIIKFELEKDCTEKEIIEWYFVHFIESLDSDHSKDENQKKQIALIKNGDVNKYLKHQPKFNSKQHLIMVL